VSAKPGAFYISWPACSAIFQLSPAAAQKRWPKELAAGWLVGDSIFKRVFNPTETIKVAVCGDGNPDIECYCEDNDIKVGYGKVNDF